MKTFWKWNRTRTEDISRICRGCGRGVAVRYALLALVATATALAQEPAPAADPPVRLTGNEYALYSQAYTFRRDHPHLTGNEVRGRQYFGTLGVEDDRPQAAGELAFAVEAVADGAAHPYCGRDPCDDLVLGVRPQTGQLYLYADVPLGRDWRKHTVNLPVADFESQRAEVSVADDATGLKVYREIVVEPPADRADCGGYPAADVDRFTCLFLGEELAAGRGDVPEAMRSALPELVQPRGNYRLLLAEEFDGAEADLSQGCENRLAGLDADIWTYGSNPCANVDADNVPCMNIEDGHLYLAKTSLCGSNVSTAGKFSYRYGYMETRVRVKLTYPGYWSNAAIGQWAGGRAFPLRHLYGRYGVDVDDYEAAGKYLGAELDLLEFVPKFGGGADLITHQYVNSGAFVQRREVPPKRSDRYVKVCRGVGLTRPFDPPPACRDGGELTATLGVEWTPMGYRTLWKIDGVHDEFEVLGEATVALAYRTWWPLFGEFYPGWQYLSFSKKVQAFRTWTTGERTSRLEAYAVAHVPADLSMSGWGYPRRWDTRIKTRLKVDYVRIFQPENGYRDMEPVYN